jgi:tRNA A-37 threonylcarbamoyl transferase component Bud32
MVNAGADFLWVRVGGLRWKVRASAPHELLRPVLADPETFLRSPQLHFKNTRTVTVARLPSAEAGHPGLVLRRLNYGQRKHQWRDWLRPARVHRALASALVLERAGVATPRALAATEVRRGRWPLRAYLLAEEVPGAQSLAHWVKTAGQLPRRTLTEFADLLARLHDRGFSHRDLKATNVLLDEHLHPVLIDLDGLRRPWRLTLRRAATDVARLAEGDWHSGQGLRWLGGRFLLRYCRRRHPPITPRLFLGLVLRQLKRRRPTRTD